MLTLRFVAAAAAFVLLMGVVGCTEDSQPRTPAPSDDPLFDLTIDVAVPLGLGLAHDWQIILDEWSAQTGANVRLREYDALDFESSLSSLMSVDATRKVMPTLFVVPVTRIAELSGEGAVSMIPDEQMQPENLNWTDVFAGLRASATSIGRRDCFIPVSSPVLVCYVRRDLLQKAGLSPPATWDEYQALLESLDRWAPGMTAVEPWGEEFRSTLFLARAASLAKHPANISYCFDINTGAPLIDHPGFVRALEMARTALPKMPPDVRRYSPADCRRELLAGRAALGIALETGPGNPPLPFGPDLSSSNAVTPAPGEEIADPPGKPPDLECIRLPGSSSVFNSSLGEWEAVRGQLNYSGLTGFGGVAIGVSAGTSRQERLAAWNLVGTLTLGHLESAFPGALHSLCRESQVAEAPRWLGNDLDPATAHSYVKAVESTLQDVGLAADLPIIGRQMYRRALSEGLGRYFDGTGDSPTAQQTLSEVSRRWHEITQETGLTRAHNSYLGALGFPVEGGEAGD